jgi:hypothetical protein
MSIIEMCNSIHLDTNHRIIGLYNVVFKIFKFKTTLGKINGLEKFVKNRFINVYNKDDNLYLFSCLAYHLDTEEYSKAKGDIRSIHKFDERIAKNFMEMNLIIINIKNLTQSVKLKIYVMNLVLVLLIIRIMRKRIHINKKV